MFHSIVATMHRVIALTLLSLTALLTAVPCHADSYLSELEAEAKSIQGEPLSPKAEEPDTPWSYNDMGMADSLKPALSQEAFEKSLKRNFIGSYTVYSRLSPTDKGKVYTAYQERNDIEELKTLIKQLYK